MKSHFMKRLTFILLLLFVTANVSAVGVNVSTVGEKNLPKIENSKKPKKNKKTKAPKEFSIKTYVIIANIASSLGYLIYLFLVRDNLMNTEMSTISLIMILLSVGIYWGAYVLFLRKEEASKTEKVWAFAALSESIFTILLIHLELLLSILKM